MNAKIPCVIAFLALTISTRGQGTFVYDQQSADENTGGGGATTIQSNQVIGQSFTPTLSQVGFIRLVVFDRNVGNSLGAMLIVNLLSNSIAGPIMSSTEPVSIPDGFGVGTGNRGYMNFLFSTPVAVVPGVTYFFQPVVQSGDSWAIVSYSYGYAGGVAFANGVAVPASDLWFREGIYIVPEPSAGLLVLFAGGLAAWRHRKTRRTG